MITLYCLGLPGIIYFSGVFDIICGDFHTTSPCDGTCAITSLFATEHGSSVRS